MTHDLCCLLLFIIGTDIKFSHTNSEIHFSGHSRGPFTSTIDYASAQWRLLLHILATCSPHVSKSRVTRDIYGIRWGWSHWPITIQHAQAQWGYVVSWRACSTGSEKAARVSRSIGILKKYLPIFYYRLKCMTCWCVISLRWCRKMAVYKCYALRLKRKNLLSPTPDACCPLLALRNIQLMTGEPRPRYSALQLLGASGAYGLMRASGTGTCSPKVNFHGQSGQNSISL